MAVKELEVRATGIRAPRRVIAVNVVYYVLLSVAALLFFFPFFWTLTTSLKRPSEVLLFPPRVFPEVPQWHNYVRVFEKVPFLRWTGNTIFVVTASTLGTLLTASLAAYAFARFEFKIRDPLFIISLGTMMLPSQVTLIPQFVLFHLLDWVDTFRPLWVPAWFGGGAFAIFLLRQFMMTLPRDLDEAAIIDGASHVRIFWNILVPLCKPVLATLAVISIIGRWNDFLGPLIYIRTSDKFTLAVGLNAFRFNSESGGQPLQHLLMAASVMATAPLIVLFFSAQQYFVQGIALTGIKG
jgi:multiple sugar transport system permease protein